MGRIHILHGKIKDSNKIFINAYIHIIWTFSSTFIYEQTFSSMTDEHLQSLLRITVTHFTQSIEELAEEKQIQIHTN